VEKRHSGYLCSPPSGRRSTIALGAHFPNQRITPSSRDRPGAVSVKEGQ
jgi:hypothetical protein